MAQAGDSGSAARRTRAGAGRVPHPRFVLFLATFLVAGAASATAVPPDLALVIGFNLAVLVFLAATLPLWRADHPDAIRRRAMRDDGGRGVLLLVSVLALLAVLGAMFTIVDARYAVTGRDILWVIATLVLAWLFVNTIFAHHYAHLYYDPPDPGSGAAERGGLSFPGTDAPDFSDFCYFAFGIGMTCQVADVTIQSRRIRRLATLHGLLAFSFNLGVMAMTINVMAGALG